MRQTTGLFINGEEVFVGDIVAGANYIEYFNICDPMPERVLSPSEVGVVVAIYGTPFLFLTYDYKNKEPLYGSRRLEDYDLLEIVRKGTEINLDIGII